jgi:hypothetical protein
MSDQAYYAQREVEERAMAEAAKDDGARSIHMTLAESYADLARREPVRANDNCGHVAAH